MERTAQQAREQFADLINTVRYTKAPITITKNGKPVVEVTPIRSTVGTTIYTNPDYPDIQVIAWPMTEATVPGYLRKDWSESPRGGHHIAVLHKGRYVYGQSRVTTADGYHMDDLEHLDASVAGVMSVFANLATTFGGRRSDAKPLVSEVITDLGLMQGDAHDDAGPVLHRAFVGSIYDGSIQIHEYPETPLARHSGKLDGAPAWEIKAPWWAGQQRDSAATSDTNTTT